MQTTNMIGIGPRVYVLHKYGSTTGAFIQAPKGDSGLYRQRERALFGPDADNPLCVYWHGLDGIAAGIPYSEELASIDGMHYTLIADPDTTANDIKRAKEALRHDHDVVGFSVLRVDELLADERAGTAFTPTGSER